MLEFEEQGLRLRGFFEDLADLKEALSYDSVKEKIDALIDESKNDTEYDKLVDGNEIIIE